MWRSSPGVPSAAHLVWLCILEHDSLRARLADTGAPLPAPVPAATRLLAGFEVLLFDAFDAPLSAEAASQQQPAQPPQPPPQEWLNELRWAFRRLNGITRADDGVYARAGAAAGPARRR